MKRTLFLGPIMLSALLAASLAAPPSFASEAYPATIANTLKLKTVPQCTLCHATILGGASTVTTKFGRSLMMRGVSGGSNIRALTNALAKEEKDPIDSDGDSVADLDELRDGSDPNVVDREPLPPDPGVGEGGSAGATQNGGAGSVAGHDPDPEGGTGGTPSTASGGSPSAAGGRALGGAASVPEQPEGPELPEIPALQTGCSFGASTPSSVSVLTALSLFGLLRSRRARRSRT